MNVGNNMNMKCLKMILASLAIGFAFIGSSVVMASPGEHCDQKQASPEKMHGHMKARLDKLAERLEIKSSQQAAWGEFTKSVEMLAERSVKKPSGDADATTISRYRAEKATEFAKKLTKIADATAKLQKLLTDDQKKTLNQVSRRFLHRDHGWSHNDQGIDRESHELNQRGSAGREDTHDENDKEIR